MSETNKSSVVRKEPFVRITKRKELGPRNSLLLKIGSIVAAIVAGGLFIAALGFNPFAVYYTIVNGAFRSAMAIESTIRLMIPLLITALGLSLAFKMRFWNIGAEGQIIMGGIFASYFALYHHNWPHWLLMLAMFLAAAVGGGLWGLIPAFFKAKFGTNETLFTLMLNYIALNVIVLLRDGIWADPESLGFPKIARFQSNAKLDMVLGVQAGWVIALVLLVVVAIYLNYTKQGYEISVVGESTPTARYAGMNVKKIILRTMMLSGAICGIAGFTQVAGSDYTLAISIAGGTGFTAIIVAWLAGLHPVGIFIASLFFSVLEKGSSVMQSTFGLSTYASQVLQGIILFFVLGGEFFIRYALVFRKKGGAEQ